MSNQNTEIKTIAQLSQAIKAPEGALYAIALRLNFSAESGEELLPQQIRDIKSAYENQSKGAPRLSGSSQSQGLAEQAPSSVQDDRPIRKPILKNIQEQYSGAASAELASRKQVLSDRLNRARDDKFQEGVLEELAGEDARIDGILTVRQGLLGKQQLEQDEYESYREKFVEGEGFLDGTAQKTYTEMPIAPARTRTKEAREAINAIKNWSIT
jgi:hypothetical protein